MKVDRTHVVVDEYCRTGVEGLYAIGDVAGAPWLAHKAMHEGVMVAELIAGQHPHPTPATSIAGCTYCWPQVASVGLTEAKAKEQGYEVKVGHFPFIGNGKAIALGEPEGMIKTVFDAKTGEMLGAHMVGAEVTELIQGYVVGRTLETTEVELMQHRLPAPDAQRDDARGGARRLRADAAHVNGGSAGLGGAEAPARPALRKRRRLSQAHPCGRGRGSHLIGAAPNRGAPMNAYGIYGPMSGLPDPDLDRQFYAGVPGPALRRLGRRPGRWCSLVGRAAGGRLRAR